MIREKDTKKTAQEDPGRFLRSKEKIFVLLLSDLAMTYSPAS